MDLPVEQTHQLGRRLDKSVLRNMTKETLHGATPRRKCAADRSHQPAL
jgi:hypothetical protein